LGDGKKRRQERLLNIEWLGKDFMKQYKANLLLLLITIFWASACLLMKISLNDLEPFNLITLRFIISVVLTGLLFYKKLWLTDWMVVKKAFILAVVLFGVFVAATYGIKWTTVSNAGFLTTIPIIFVPLFLAIFYKQRLQRRVLVGIVIAVIGVALLTVNESLSVNSGDLLCILCSLFYALYMILIDKYSAQVDAIALAIIQFAFVGVFNLVFCLMFETPKLPSTLSSWIVILALSLLCTSAAFIIQAVVLRHTTSIQAGLIFCTQPFFTAVLAFLFLGEGLSAQGYLGAAILLIGIIITEFDLKGLARLWLKGDNFMNQVEIVAFEERYHEDYKRLAYEWLEKYVSVEPEDEKILNDPWGVVLNNGGHIFMAKRGEEIIGTASLIKLDTVVFELAKFAVTEKYKGLKIGNILMEKCIEMAKRESAKKLILYTNKKLVPAIGLYRKFGFTEVPVVNSKYLEADMMMEASI